MNLRMLLIIPIAVIFPACSGNKPPAANTATSSSPAAATPSVSKNAGPLPANGFKAQITLANPPAKLRAGQKETIVVHVKNVSDVMWWLRGGEINEGQGNRFYIAVGNRWLDKDGKRTTEMEGRNAIPRDLRPGEESDVSLLITAPKQAGDYQLEVDMIQEQVSWFGEKGSPTFKAPVTVAK
jgi:hypothetical protein